jgi:hypothetical protein
MTELATGCEEGAASTTHYSAIVRVLVLEITDGRRVAIGAGRFLRHSISPSSRTAITAKGDDGSAGGRGRGAYAASASSAKAKAAGVYKGRPALIDATQVRAMKAQGLATPRRSQRPSRSAGRLSPGGVGHAGTDQVILAGVGRRASRDGGSSTIS